MSFRSLLLKHGYSFLFACVFGVQAGIPIPADPLLLLMGAMAGDHRYSFWAAVFTAMAAALLGDCVWYEIGRHRGRSVLGLLCRFSLEPDTCVRKTESAFTKRGPWTLLFAKFIPGMSLIAMPLAGTIRMPRWRFVLADMAGCAIWAATYLITGYVLHRQVDEVVEWLGLFGRRAGVVVILLIALYIGFRYFQRWRFLRQVRTNRITPHAVLSMMEGGTPLTIIDLRHPADVARDGVKVAGALLLRPDELRSRSHEIPRDQEIILYCT